jgi:PAS domain S-box-containing protein
MRSPASILLLEHDDTDAAEVAGWLARADIPISVVRAVDRDAFIARLREGAFDLVLAEFDGPSLPDASALDVAAAIRPETPFIFLSETLGEEFAIETLKRGATDYVLKQRIARLPSAVERALIESRTRAARRRAEEALDRLTRESERRRRLYETVLSNTPDLVYVFDLDHRFTYANEVLLGMWNRTWDEAIGKNCLELGYPEWHAAMHDREIEQVKATRQPIRGEVPFHGAYGRRIYDYIFVPVLGPDGEVEAIAGTTRDVTDRKAAEQELALMADSLRDLNRRKDEFLATLAHELRNPLAPIRNGLTYLRLDRDAPDAERMLDMMDRQLRHLVRIVDDLLDVSRVTNDKINLRRERLDLRDVIGTAVETVRGPMASANQTLALNLPPTPVPTDGDETRLVQMVANLLANASKYTRPGGRITLDLEVDGGDARVRVTDTGIGIPPERLASVFEMFTQLDTALDRSPGGLGIGLALVKKLTEMHGGRVWAESDGPGSGATFTIALPLAVAAANAA